MSITTKCGEYKVSASPYALAIFEDMAKILLEARKENPSLTFEDVFGSIKWVELKKPESEK